MPAPTEDILALSGGVGGAKLADGLAQILTPEQLTIAVNVGDDFEHLGLPVWPDLDTVLYTLAGKANPELGWGRAGESWGVMEELRALGAPDWFLLGDRDIALHLLRRHLLEQGLSHSAVATHLARSLDVQHWVVPVTDQPLRTLVATDEGELEFQRYFVGRRAQPVLRGLTYSGADQARLSPAVESALQHPDLAGIVICPSNPYLSVMPMLSIPGLREALRDSSAPVIAVSPIVGGAALKGPAAKIMTELGVEPKATITADLYDDFVDLNLIDTTDAALAEGDPRVAVTATVMRTREDRKALAAICLQLLAAL